MRGSQLLFIGICLLLSAAIILSSSIISYPHENFNERQPLPSAEPTKQSTIAFSTSYALSRIKSRYASLVIFDVNGSYTFNENASIKITNTRGNLIFNYPVKSGDSNYYHSNATGSFPIQVLLPEEGTYVASFEFVNFAEGTFIMAYSLPVEWISMPAFFQYFGFLLVVGGVTCFSVGWIMVLLKPSKENQLFFKKDEKLTFDRFGILISLLSVLLASAIIITPFQIIKIELIFQIAFQAIVAALVIFYALFSIKKLRNISSVSYERIRDIEKNAKLYLFISTILFSISFIFSFFQNQSNYLSALSFFFYIIGVFIFLLMSPFFSILSEKGKLVLPLRKFSRDYKDNILGVDYTLLALSSKKIRDYYKSIGLMISQNALSVGLYSYVMNGNKTNDIEELDKCFSNEKSPPHQSITLVKGFVSEGCKLEKIKIKALPSFLERYSQQVKYFATTLAIVATIITIAQFALGVL